MKKTLATCAFAGTALALGMSLPVGHAATTTPTPTPTAEVSTNPLPPTQEFYEPTPPGMPVVLPYCADGVTESPADGSCVPYLSTDESVLVETPPIVEGLMPPVYTLDEALAQCATYFAGVDETDCTAAAYTSWGATDPAYVETDPMEDEPGWDCRTMGNYICGVDIMGTWYLVQFIDGLPSMVTVR